METAFDTLLLLRLHGIVLCLYVAYCGTYLWRRRSEALSLHVLLPMAITFLILGYMEIYIYGRHVEYTMREALSRM